MDRGFASPIKLAGILGSYFAGLNKN